MTRRGHAVLLGVVAAVIAVITWVSLAFAAGGSHGTTSAGSSHGTKSANRRAAELEAARALAAVSLPPGATRAALDPSGGALAVAATRPLSPRLVDRHAFWRVPGAPQSVITWIEDHRPAGSEVTGTGTGSRSGGQMVTLVQLSFVHPPAGVVSSAIGVAATALPSGDTAVRVDADAVWLLIRPAWAHVPASVQALTITVQRLGKSPAAPVTVTAPTRVRRIVRLVNQLPVWQLAGGPVNCPAIRGPSVKVAFLRRAGDSAPVAVATADGSGCGEVRLEVRGRTAPMLTDGPKLIAALGIG